MRRFAIGVLCFIAVIGCSSHETTRMHASVSTVRKPEDDLSANQRKVLNEWTTGIKTRNSVADIGRLKDSLKRWDELFMNPASPDMKPVFAILRERVKERLAELEQEAASKPN